MFDRVTFVDGPGVDAEPVVPGTDAASASAGGAEGAVPARIGGPKRHIDLQEELARLKRLKHYTVIRRLRTLAATVASAFIQAYTMQAFVYPADLLSSGFTGVAILIDKITSLVGFSFPTFLGMLALNIPVALICWKSISHRFVIFSMIQVFLASMFLRFFNFEPLFDDQILQVVFGGFLYGLGIAVALKGGSSTAGTDFISLMVSNKTGQSIWGFIFAGNCVVLIIFGVMFSWEAAAWSIVFQFISTKAIEMFYHRYDRVTLQVTTRCPDEVLAAYNTVFRHGSSVVKAMGGRSHEDFWVITTVVSTYEVSDIVQLARFQDERAIVNVMRTEDFFGGFYRAPID